MKKNIILFVFSLLLSGIIAFTIFYDKILIGDLL